MFADRIGDCAGGRNGNYGAPDVDVAFAEVYVTYLDTVAELARDYEGREEDMELRLLERNDSMVAV